MKKNNVPSSDFTAEGCKIVSRSKFQNMKIYYVYVLQCADNSYYTGITSNLTQRMTEHESGKHKDSYTYSRRPIQLVFYAEFTNVEIAISTEKQIKKWSRAKKEALIRGDFEALPNLAKKTFNKPNI
ncbi:putative endonuclease [Flavobacteriaceae bacterium MAR_2010_105]|nr:putative endonuclease [Flavobacteriaceae bacterium MAR_2010_105]